MSGKHIHTIAVVISYGNLLPIGRENHIVRLRTTRGFSLWLL